MTVLFLYYNYNCIRPKLVFLLTYTVILMGTKISIISIFFAQNNIIFPGVLFSWDIFLGIPISCADLFGYYKDYFATSFLYLKAFTLFLNHLIFHVRSDHLLANIIKNDFTWLQANYTNSEAIITKDIGDEGDAF